VIDIKAFLLTVPPDSAFYFYHYKARAISNHTQSRVFSGVGKFGLLCATQNFCLGMMTLKKPSGIFLLALMLFVPATTMAWSLGNESTLDSVPRVFCQFVSAASGEGESNKKEEEEEEEPDCD